MKLLGLIVGGILALIFVLVAGLLTWARFSDGPKGPLPGGSLVSGELADASTVNWNEVLGNQPVAEIALEVEAAETSRVTGAFVHEGQLYVPCDLGFVWRRMPPGVTRLLLHTIWLFKDWHLQVEQDNRVIVRKQGKRYRLQAVRVHDDKLLDVFRDHVSQAAAQAFELGPVQTNTEDIWFFRLEPRTG
ncbi:MAG: hypothetical protein AAF993_00070 [Pseudomonadota bacterium]